VNVAEGPSGRIALEANSNDGGQAGQLAVMHWVARGACSKVRWSRELKEGREEKNTEHVRLRDEMGSGCSSSGRETSTGKSRICGWRGRRLGAETTRIPEPP